MILATLATTSCAKGCPVTPATKPHPTHFRFRGGGSSRDNPKKAFLTTKVCHANLMKNHSCMVCVVSLEMSTFTSLHHRRRHVTDFLDCALVSPAKADASLPPIAVKGVFLSAWRTVPQFSHFHRGLSKLDEVCSPLADLFETSSGSSPPSREGPALKASR